MTFEEDVKLPQVGETELTYTLEVSKEMVDRYQSLDDDHVHKRPLRIMFEHLGDGRVEMWIQTDYRLTFERMSVANAKRCEHWHGPDWTSDEDPWTLADWANAMAGECGEACNIVKKIRRIDAGLWEAQKYPGDSSMAEGLAVLEAEVARRVLIDKLGDELADVILYLDLLATKAGINLEEGIRDKFNRVSVAQDFPERL